jgi:hypothetical protein
LTVDNGLLDRACVLDPRGHFGGLSYGELIARWTKWLMSEDPDNSNTGDILFFRGNIGHHKDPHSFYCSEIIETVEKRPILIPVIATHFNIGDDDDGSVIDDESSLRQAIHHHVSAAGPVWATIQELEAPGEPTKRLVQDLKLFRFESPVFSLKVSKNNPFLNKMDVSISPGVYKGITGGYFVVITNLRAGTYRARFGGKGLGNFYTDSLYEFKIVKREPCPMKDRSGIYVSKRNLSANSRKA